jgi:hypothetical protein
MEMADQNIERELFDFINENKDKDDFKVLFIDFYSNVKNSCSNEARSFFDRIIIEIESGNLSQEKLEETSVVQEDENKRQKTEIEFFLEKEL